VKGPAGEPFATGDVGKERLVQKTRRADEDVGDIGVAFGRLEVPTTVGEPRRDDLLLEVDEFGEAAVTRDLLNVGPDLGGRRILARPIVVGLERKLVLTRQDIVEETGKSVVSPGPADIAGLFVDGEIDPGALQRLGHEQPRHARAGDDNPKSSISHYASHDQPDLRRSKFRPLDVGSAIALSPALPAPSEADGTGAYTLLRMLLSLIRIMTSRIARLLHTSASGVEPVVLTSHE
jgi:hypothetical protein